MFIVSLKMTISYNLDISSSSSWSFMKIIFRWKGSIWKSVLTELCIWTVFYYVVFCIYRFLLFQDQQRSFALFALHVDEKLDYIPLTFMLGFFVTIVVDRWKNIFANIGFVDNSAFFVSAYIRGEDEETKIVRRNMIRYLCLTQVLVLRDISITVRKRFPNIEAVVDAGFLQLHEKELMDNVTNGFTKYWMPINWVFAIAYDMRAKGKITADVLLNGLLVEVRTYRGNLQNLCNYDWVPVPLAYPQVVFLAVRVYFLLTLVSRQFIITENVENSSAVDLYVPFMTQLQLVFYMGWLKVAEALLNPLGEDDDDFECNYIIDRNISIALSMVDDCHAEIPSQVRDKFEDGNKPLYSEVSSTMPIHALLGSACTVKTDEAKDRVKMVPHINEGGSIDNRSIGSGRHQGPSDGLYKRRLSSRIKDSLTNWRSHRSMSLRTGMGTNLQVPHTSINLDTPIPPKVGLQTRFSYPAIASSNSTAERGAISSIEENLKTANVKPMPSIQQLDTVSEEEESNNSSTSTTCFSEPPKKN